MKTQDVFLMLSQIESAIAELDQKGTNEAVTQAMSIVRAAGELLQDGKVPDKGTLLRIMRKKANTSQDNF